MSLQPSLRPNSINISGAALEALLDRLDEPDSKSGACVRRGYVRWPFRRPSINVGLIHPGGNTVMIRCAGRNLSNGGICVLHSSFVHSGSDCIVFMPHPTQGDVQVRGRIIRCMHRSGVIHEIGIAFPRPINAKEYLAPDPLSNNFALERVRVTDLHGRVLVIEPNQTERDIIRHYLRETDLTCEFAMSLAHATTMYDGYAAVVMSSELPDSDPRSAANKMKELGHAGPILLVVPDDSARTRARVASAPVRAFLTRPFSQELLFRALGEVLLVENSSNPARRGSGDARAKAAPDDEVTRLGKALFSAVFNRDAAAVRAACVRIRTLAESRSWIPLIALVNQVQSSLDRGGSIDSVMTVLELIIAACDSGTEDSKRVA